MGDGSSLVAMPMVRLQETGNVPDADLHADHE